jgi:hypothetical protein
MTDEIRCSNCAYFVSRKFKGTKPGTIGVCHRNPPKPVFDTGEMKKHSVTLTAASYWCGEFAERPKEESAAQGDVH